MKNTRSLQLMKSSILHFAVAVFFIFAAITTAYAAETWRDSFDDVCGKVPIAGDLSEKELADLITKADAVLPEIQKSDDAAKKVFIKRLKNCRGVFEFMLDTKKTGEK